MSSLLIEIQYTNGKSESLEVDAERVVMGSGAHCDVRMPLQAAANEQVLVEVLGETVRIEALAAEPVTMLDGNVVQRAVLVPGSVLKIGDTQVRISLNMARDADDAVKAKKKKDANNSALRIGAMLLLGVGGYVLMTYGDGGFAPEPNEAPPLFSDEPAECSAKIGSQAAILGNDKRVAADGKRERHPFYIAEGVESVILYEQAAACYRVAKETALAGELDIVARQLRADVQDDARVRRLRLARSIGAGDAQQAKREILALRVLYKGKDGPYVNWLNGLARSYDVDKDRE